MTTSKQKTAKKPAKSLTFEQKLKKVMDLLVELDMEGFFYAHDGDLTFHSSSGSPIETLGHLALMHDEIISTMKENNKE